MKLVKDPDTRTPEEKKKDQDVVFLRKQKVAEKSAAKEAGIAKAAKADKLYKVHTGAPVEPAKGKKSAAFKSKAVLVKAKSKAEAIKKTKDARQAFEVADDYKLPKGK